MQQQSDDETSYVPRRKRKGVAQKAPPKQKQLKHLTKRRTNTFYDFPTVDKSLTNSSDNKSDDSGRKRRQEWNSPVWYDERKAKFYEGLKLFDRDLEKVTEHIGGGIKLQQVIKFRSNQWLKIKHNPKCPEAKYKDLVKPADRWAKPHTIQ